MDPFSVIHYNWLFLCLFSGLLHGLSVALWCLNEGHALQIYDGFHYGYSFWVAVLTAGTAIMTSFVAAVSFPPKSMMDDYVGVLT